VSVGKVESVQTSEEFVLPVASSIFSEIDAFGFDVNSWANHDREGFQQALSAVTKLLSEKTVQVREMVSIRRLMMV
jgi:hypothetical protein